MSEVILSEVHLVHGSLNGKAVLKRKSRPSYNDSVTKTQHKGIKGDFTMPQFSLSWPLFRGTEPF